MSSDGSVECIHSCTHPAPCVCPRLSIKIATTISGSSFLDDFRRRMAGLPRGVTPLAQRAPIAQWIKCWPDKLAVPGLTLTGIWKLFNSKQSSIGHSLS